LWLDVLPIATEGSTDIARDTDGAFEWSSNHTADAWNPDMEWDSDTVCAIGRHLEAAGLKPEAPQIRCGAQAPSRDSRNAQPRDTQKSITVIVPPARWPSAEGDDSRLICVISINGTFMHLEAIRVRSRGRSRIQQAVHAKHQGDFDLLCQFGSEGQFETTEINGKSYVLVATPFA
jgi:hypothetical protein